MPDPNAQIPTPDELIGPGIDVFVGLRPRALAHINSGRGLYAAMFAGWRAQGVLMLRRLVDFARNGRLKFATGEPLRILAASEFDTPSADSATRAIGQVVLSRTGASPGGTIRAGARFKRPADTSSSRLYREAQYECSVDTYVAQGQATVTVPIRASREGEAANRPYTGTPSTELVIADEIVDKDAWTVVSYEAGGGSSGASDDDRRRYAKRYARGRFGPTADGGAAGAYKLGARHIAPFDDVTMGELVLYLADASWAGSTAWVKAVEQGLYDDNAVGFGCRIRTAFVQNEIVGAEVTVRVRDTSFLADTSALTIAIQGAIRSHLDDRDDFWAWRYSALRGVVARASRSLLSCSSVVLRRPDGSVVSEPVAGAVPKHYLLVDSAVKVTFLSPD